MPIALAAAATLLGAGPQDDPRAPSALRSLTAPEVQAFDLGHAVFNTQWAPAGEPAGRRDGLGPLFNAPSCDGCHNSRRRGRGPLDSGAAPLDLVMQVGMRSEDGRISRGSDRFGFIVNTQANGATRPEAAVAIRYEETSRRLADGTLIRLRRPVYEIVPQDGAPLPGNLVLMPRMPPAVHGVGLLERVPARELETLAARTAVTQGRVARVVIAGQTQIGRFGWQATEPSVARQIAVAFSREMGLTTALEPRTDCSLANAACLAAPSGGTPEVEPELFEAVVFFNAMHAVPRAIAGISRPQNADTARIAFTSIGCADCHRTELRALPVPADAQERIFQPYTDLLLHDLGPALADRDASGATVPSDWRTAPLWGLSASMAARRPLRLLHDGRARSVEEAIGWHEGEAADARTRFENLPMRERENLLRWIENL